MAYIGRNPLPKEVVKQIKQQLVRFLYDRSGGKNIFHELVTETEQIMLAKRLGALLMLIDEQSYYRIEQVLGMSVSTSKRLHQMLLGGDFAVLEQFATNKKHREEIIETVGLILRGGLPPYAYVIKKRK